MIQLAEEFFKTKNDPAQISVTPDSIDKLLKIHPGTLTEETDANGPIAWILIIPTTRNVMKKFLAHQINEQELLVGTPVGKFYDAIYLCSALVLPEYRGKGLAKRLTTEAIEAIRIQHPIQSLFYWSFSVEGENLAAAVAKACNLPLHQRF